MTDHQQMAADAKGRLYMALRESLKAQNLATNEALETLDFILEVAGSYYQDDPHRELTELWRQWDWLECLAAANNQLEDDLRGEAEG